MSHGTTKGHAHVASWKTDEVARLTKLIVDNEVVAVAQIGGIPGPQMAEMRDSIRENISVIGVKNRLLRLALIEAAKQKPGVDQLSASVDGQTALVTTSGNPFKLYKMLRAGATMAPLSGGAIAPMDIVLKKGPTPFGPGPIVGEFQKVGIPAKIEAGKVVISKESIPVKAGERVSQELAVMLSKLNIKPVELSIKLEAAFEGDTMFLPNVLAVDDAAVLAQLQLAVRTAHELSIQTAFPTKRTADALVAKAYKQAIALVVEKELSIDAASEAVVTEAYANLLATIGKKPADLTDAVKKRLGEYLEILNQVAVAAPAAAASSAAPAEEEEEEGVSEEEAAAGLGALFG